MDPIYHPTRNKITSIILPRQTACERRAQIARRLDEEFGEGLRIDKDGLVVNARLARRRLHAKKHGAHALAARVGEAEEGAAAAGGPAAATAGPHCTKSSGPTPGGGPASPGVWSGRPSAAGHRTACGSTAGGAA